MRKATAIFLAIALGFPIGIWMASWQIPWWAALYIFGFFVSWFWGFGRIFGSHYYVTDAMDVALAIVSSGVTAMIWPMGIWLLANFWTGPNYWNKFDPNQRV